MKLVSSKAFRARLAEFSALAESETIFISRPGGRLLQLTAVPEGDKKQILRTVGEKDTEITTRAYIDPNGEIDPSLLSMAETVSMPSSDAREADPRPATAPGSQ